jgi:hypothetical protein
MPRLGRLELFERIIEFFDELFALLQSFIELLAKTVGGHAFRKPRNDARKLAFGAVDFLELGREHVFGGS